MPLFSVIVPLYNKEKSIQNTLKSALDQTFTDFEIIIINDGSTDQSESKALAINDSRIRLFSTENQGVSAARNYGIAKASGTLIAFLDADDYWFPNHLKQLSELYEMFPQCGLYCTNYERFYNPNKIIKPTYIAIPHHPWKGIVNDFFQSSYIDRIAWTSAVAVPKTVIDTAGNFKTTITLGAGEDTDLWLRIALRFDVAFDNEISARHMLDAENRVSLASTLKRSFAKLDEFKEEEKNNPSLKKYLDLHRIFFAIRHKLAGDVKTFNFYMQSVDRSNIPFKTKIILAMPTFLIRKLYAFKKYLEQKNILISIYD
ncbi:glycosyltransferase involved in cell wall biosynthesis [Flavobacterium endophyticum]|uniref:Glycosyltransferase involved in cell wall biosynthesis n=1 Tax=Flavobacterium endophyticum TaxID=1540163 RepID=A0A495LWN3_9FLAO|nr:glycosyltransferase family A protein [Flavobacterium endophyticum]RKS17518.1 glycosyltransferase involved in cell wall biosynthesis [Flavobacterium endophyticum]